MNSQAAAAGNTLWLSENLASGKPFTIPSGTLYVRGTASTKATVGCGVVKTNGAGSYPIEPFQTDITGNVTRIVQLGKGPIFRVAGAGFHCEDPLELVGDGESTAIEIEGRTHPSTGRHTFANITFYNWGCAFDALAGYYKDSKFTRDENHADNVKVTNCQAFNCDVYFRSQNQQAVNWVFIDCGMWVIGKAKDVIFADIQRGGLVTVERLVGSHPKLTVFRVKDYSPNTSRLVCREYHGDRIPVEGWYLRPIEYVGPDWQTNVCDYYFEFTGFVACYQANVGVEYKVPENFPRRRWKIELQASGN